MGRVTRSLSQSYIWWGVILILVLCGTQKQDFSRMLSEIEKLSLQQEVIVQAGHTAFKSINMTIFNFMSSEELSKLYKKADYVITHGGAGSMLQAIKNNKKVLVFPRLKKYEEHVDDHQLQLSNKLSQLRCLMVFNDGDDIFEIFDNLQSFEPQPFNLKGKIPELLNESLKKILFS